MFGINYVNVARACPVWSNTLELTFNEIVLRELQISSTALLLSCFIQRFVNHVFRQAESNGKQRV